MSTTQAAPALPAQASSPLPRVAFVTQEKQENASSPIVVTGLEYSDAVVALLAQEKKKFVIEPAVWSDHKIDWEEFDLIVFRSTWDYIERIDEFKAFLHTLGEKPNICNRVCNSVQLMTWNMDKFYLGELAQAGIPSVPTEYIRSSEIIENPDLADVRAIMNRHDWKDCVIKPTVSNSAKNTVRVRLSDGKSDSGIQEADSHIRRLAEQGLDVVVQQFMEGILHGGEYSLVYFNGKLSHTLGKMPKSGDFRVQTHLGAKITAVEAPECMQKVAAKALDFVRESRKEQQVPLYVRVDCVPTNRECTACVLLELEMIEPYFFFEHLPEGPVRTASIQAFYDAIVERMS
jgi:glutathione synthase/RimK-type ligase-like ATP-grasp enzyme